MRGERAKAKRNSMTAARKQAAADQLPKAPGDMQVKGKTDTGQLLYSWQNFEVPSTPRRLRPSLPEGVFRTEAGLAAGSHSRARSEEDATQ